MFHDYYLEINCVWEKKQEIVHLTKCELHSIYFIIVNET